MSMSLIAAIFLELPVVLVLAAAEPCMLPRDREHIRELSLTAIDQALMNHVAKLFDVWLKDFSPEPKRATAGMTNGISAYQRARANALKWNPPACGE